MTGSPPAIRAISSGIGRGHPAYLDAVLEALRAEPGFDPGRFDVLELADLCRPPARAAWSLARALYRAGGTGGIVTAAYNRLRRGSPAGWQLRLLGTGLRERLAGFDGICLVEHPLVARILAPVCRVAYLHAELAAPASTAVAGTWRTFVPLPETADRLAAHGVRREALTVTGLVIEPRLVETADVAHHARLRRLSLPASPASVGFFTSGAYPRPHVQLILAGVRSCLGAGLRATVFCGTDPRVAERFRRTLGNPRDLTLVSAPTRRAETALAVERFPELDVMVAAAHERTGWAVGLGLPLLILGPDIGPFAPLNRACALAAGVARPLGDAADARALGVTIQRLRADGGLRTMAESGFGRVPTGGAAVTARCLLASSSLGRQRAVVPNDVPHASSGR